MANGNLAEAARLAALADEDRRKKRIEADKERLLKVVETRMRTVFIGALAKFEERFGPETDPVREAQRAAWRTEVLNNGNAQLRAVLAELGLHRIEREGAIWRA